MRNTTGFEGKNKYWWIPFLSGLILVLFGILFFVEPLDSFQTLTIIFGVILLTDGVLEVYIALRNKDYMVNYLSYLWGGILNGLLGILLMIKPGAIMVIISILIGFWLIFKGGEIIKKAFHQKKLGNTKWKTNMLFGVVLFLFAAILLWHPEIIGFTIAFWTSLAFILLGVLRIYWALSIRSLVD